MVGALHFQALAPEQYGRDRVLAMTPHDWACRAHVPADGARRLSAQRIRAASFPPCPRSTWCEFA